MSIGTFFKDLKPILLDYSSPTTADWATRIWELNEIKSEYMEYLKDWLDEGLELEKLIFSPRVYNIHIYYEFMLAIKDKQIMLLQKDVKGEIHKTLIDKKEIVYVQHTEELLRCTISIGYVENGELKVLNIRYSQAAEHLFLPYLDMVLDVPEGFNCYDAFRKHPCDEKMMQEQYSLYNFSRNAFRMGDRILDYEWHYYRIGGYQSLFLKTTPALMLCHMEKGYVLIEHYGHNVRYSYFQTDFVEIDNSADDGQRLIINVKTDQMSEKKQIIGLKLIKIKPKSKSKSKSKSKTKSKSKSKSK